MTEESCPKAAPDVSAAAAARQRRKRKWDQPAESLISSGLAVSRVFPLQIGALTGVCVPGIAPLAGSVLVNSVAAVCTTASQLNQAPAFQQNAAALIQKLNQPKIQDELIAREIVINDAEAAVRCKLTKRQTQEEIQKCTGAVVITRGKYRPPNALPDNEKPLYLHISAGAHLKDTAERIKAVDHAATTVEEILKQSQSSHLASSSHLVFNSGQVLQPLSKCVYLGFDPDPSLNIVARIRGPNDQYINHIMNETGANVMLRGRGSENVEIPHSGDAQEPLHLHISSNNPKGLEDARILAENLLDTICLECGASRVSSCKVYRAVPPPQQLLNGVEKSGNVTGNSVSVSICSTVDSTTAKPFVTAAPVSAVSNICPPRSLLQHGGLVSYGHQKANAVPYHQPTITGGTSYSGYGGIYPQATPLQQVALALRQAPASTASATATSLPPTTVSTVTASKMTLNSDAETDKRPQRRKFQELPVASNGPPTFHQNLRQGSESVKPGVSSDNLPVRDAASIPPPKKLVELQANGMLPPFQESMLPPPPQKNMPLPPPLKSMPPLPPTFTSTKLPVEDEHENGSLKAPSTERVSDTLMKLMEYGDDDEDTDGNSEECSTSNLIPKATAKPFWAV